MEEKAEQLEDTLQLLGDSIRALEARVAALEGAAPASLRPPETVAAGDFGLPEEDLSFRAPGGLGLAAGLALVGSTFLILGGAFLLRALTDSEVLPRNAGILAGLAYALLWTTLAGRAAAAGRGAVAGFRSIAAALVAYPLIWEATTRFEMLTPDLAAITLVIVTVAGLGIALRNGSPFLAGVFTSAAAATGLALLFRTGSIASFTILVVALGVVSLWLAYIRNWEGPRWFAAGVANLALLRLLALAARAEAEGSGNGTLIAIEWIALGYLLAYLGSFGIRTLAGRRDVGVFEILQSAIVLLLGLGGAARVSLAAGIGGTGLGVASAVAGLGCYAVAFLFVTRRAGGGRNFFFYSSLGLVLLLAACPLLGGAGVCTVTWGLLAIAAAAVGGRFDRVTLRAHAVVFVAAAAVKSGLLASFADAATGPVGTVWRDARWAPWALGVAIISYGLLVATRSFRSGPRLARIPRTILAALSVIGLASCVVIAGSLLAGRSSGGEVAAIRTLVLAAATILLAVIHRRARLPELGWLAWTLLGLGAAKLVLEDLRAGGAWPLFLAFAVYGIALIVTPRLLRAGPHRALQPTKSDDHQSDTESDT